MGKVPPPPLLGKIRAKIEEGFTPEDLFFGGVFICAAALSAAATFAGVCYFVNLGFRCLNGGC